MDGERNQKGTRECPSEHSLRSIQSLPAQLSPDTLRSLTIRTPEATVTISSLTTILDTQGCLIVLRSESDTTGDLLKNFRRAFVELATDTFAHMHILLAPRVRSSLAARSCRRCSRFRATRLAENFTRREWKINRTRRRHFPASRSRRSFSRTRKARNRGRGRREFHSLANVNIVTAARAYIVYYDFISATIDRGGKASFYFRLYRIFLSIPPPRIILFRDARDVITYFGRSVVTLSFSPQARFFFYLEPYFSTNYTM